MNKMKRTIVAFALALVLAPGIGVVAQTLCPCAVYRWHCEQYIWPGILISEYDWFTTDNTENWSSNMGFWWTQCANLGLAYYE